MDNDRTVVEALELGIDADEEALGIERIMRIRIGRIVIVTMETVEGLAAAGISVPWPTQRHNVAVGTAKARAYARSNIERVILGGRPHDGTCAVGFAELTRNRSLGPITPAEPPA